METRGDGVSRELDAALHEFVAVAVADTLHIQDHIELLLDRLTAQLITKGLDGNVAVPSAVDRELPDGLEALEGCTARLPADDLAEQPAQETNVVARFLAARRVEVAGGLESRSALSRRQALVKHAGQFSVPGGRV